MTRITNSTGVEHMAADFSLSDAATDQLRKAETDLCVQKRCESDHGQREKLAVRINAIRAELRRRIAGAVA